MKRIWTIIGVRDVATSFKWYQSLFGQRETAPSHDHFAQLMDADETVLLCLHKWGEHEHPSLTSPDVAPPGNGLLLFFRVDDYDHALNRARALVARFAEEPHVNPNTQTREFSLRDPDGYYVTISEVYAQATRAMHMTRVKTSTPPNTPTPIGPYSHIAMVGDFITVGGTAGFDPATGQLAGADAYLQTKQILDSFRVMLESVGSDLDHVVHVNVFLRRMSDFEEMNRAYVEKMGEHRPARTVIGVNELPKPGILLTMNLTAVTRSSK